MNHQNLRYATVEVQFQEILDKDPESEEFEVIKGTEFSIRRTVNHASVSKYEINRKESTQAQVVETLLKKGIDLTNNRFLILQGEVEQISMMKPRSGDPDKPGLLEYLEDLIGSNKYKEQIDKYDEEYDQLQDVRRERGEKMRITEGDLEKLMPAKNMAIEFIRKEKNIYQIINVVEQIKRFRANREIIS